MTRETAGWGTVVAGLVALGAACSLPAGQLEVSNFSPVVWSPAPVDAGQPEPALDVTATGCWRAVGAVGGYGARVTDLAPLPSGEALVGWLSRDSQQVWVAVLRADGGAISPVLVARSGLAIEELSLSANASGEAALIWVDVQSPGLSRALMLARRDAAGVWRAPEVVAGPMPGLGWSKVAMDAQGGVLVAWGRQADSGQALEVRRWRPGTGWLPVEVVSPPDTFLLAQSLQVTPAGLGVLAWMGYSAPDYVIKVRARTWSGGVGTDAVLEPDGTQAGFLSVAALGEEAVVSWFSLAPGARVLATRFQGGAWSPPEEIHAFPARQNPAPGPLASFDAVGAPAVWVKWDAWPVTGDEYVLARSSWRSQGWSAPLRTVVGRPPGYLRGPAVASDGRGRELIAAAVDLELRVWRGDPTWETPETVTGLIVHFAGIDAIRTWLAQDAGAWLQGTEAREPWRSVFLFCP